MHALGTIIDHNGKSLVREPRNGFPTSVRSVQAGCEVGGGDEATSIDPNWGERGLTAVEKIYGWNSYFVLAMLLGRQHGPDGHFLIAPSHEGIAAFAGIWWDLGEKAIARHQRRH
jgi:hypothetical protein